MNEETEFLKESNAIEREYSDEALEDAKHAWNFAKRHKHMINIDFIKGVHQELMHRLNLRIAGKIRDVDVYVGDRKCLNPKEIIKTLEAWCKIKYKTEDDIMELHVQFEKIHPFEDGNGRTGRILMNVQRLKLKLPLLIIHEGDEQFEYYQWFKK